MIDYPVPKVFTNQTIMNVALPTLSFVRSELTLPLAVQYRLLTLAALGFSLTHWI